MSDVVSIGIRKKMPTTKVKKLDLRQVKFLWVYLILGKAALWVAILWIGRY